MDAVPVDGSGVDYGDGSSQPGWSIEERYVARGLSSRAARIRRPMPGATRTKSPVSAATATTGTLGTSPPDVPGLEPPDEPSSPRGEKTLRARSGEAGRTVGRFTVGVDAARVSVPAVGRQVAGLPVGDGAIAVCAVARAT